MTYIKHDTLAKNKCLQIVLVSLCPLKHWTCLDSKMNKKHFIASCCKNLKSYFTVSLEYALKACQCQLLVITQNLKLNKHKLNKASYCGYFLLLSSDIGFGSKSLSTTKTFHYSA